MRINLQPCAVRALEVVEAGCHTMLLVTPDVFEARNLVEQAAEDLGDQWDEMMGPGDGLRERVKYAKPCPCGRLADRALTCNCDPVDIRAYWRAQEALVSGADIVLRLARPKGHEVAGLVAQVSGGVAVGPWDELEREAVDTVQVALRDGDVATYEVAETAVAILQAALDNYGMGTSSLVSTIRVARTVALLEEAKDSVALTGAVAVHHMAEAVQYKSSTANTLAVGR